MDFDNASGFAAVKQPRIASVWVWVTDADTGEIVVDQKACSPVSS
ncbi:hypothetical protein JCM12296A_36300 [Desulfosarcina cetonica]